MNNMPADKNRRVLVIDDNRAIHDDFRKILSPATAAAAELDASEEALFGYSTAVAPPTQFEVDSAYQGQEGVLLAAKALEAGRPYAMAFVDVRMPPGWDGVETTGKLWELDPSLQVVLCTAYSDYSWGEMFEQLGQRDGLLILKKPFDAVEAFQLAHALTEKWWLHQESRRKMEELESRVAGRTQELAKSLSLLNATLESTADGVVATDLSGKIVSHNTKFAAIWQFPAGLLDRRDAAEMRAHTVRQVKDSAKFLQRINELRADPEAEGFDVIELQDGRTFERYVFPQRIDGECVGAVINWRDITERKRAEAELSWKTAFLEAQVNSSIDGILVVDQEGKQALRNQRFVDLLKIPQHIVDEKDDENRLRWVTSMTKNPEQFASKVRDLYAHPTEISHDEVELKDGTILDRYSAPVVGKDGQYYGRIWTFRDITERKRAAAVLAQERGLLRTVIDALPDFIYVKDCENKFRLSNLANAHLLGLASPEQLVGKTDFDFFPSELATEYQVTEQTVINTGQPLIDVEERLFDLAGATRWQLTTQIPLRDSEGKVSGLVGLGRDITERKRAEEALQQSEERYRLLVEESPDGIGIYQEGKLVFINSTGIRLMGAKAQAELLGRKGEEFIHPDDHAGANDRIRRRLAGGTGMYPAEVRYLRLDGTPVPVEVSAAPTTFNGKPATQFIARDITERKRGEEALRESEERFSSAFAHAPIGVALVSPDGHWLQVNRALCELVGYSEAELLTRTFQDITHPDDLEGDLENVRRMIAGEVRAYQMEKRYVHKQGHLVTVLLDVSLVRDGQGQPRYFIAQIQDITERKRAENTLRESDEKFHQLADNITDAFWIRSPDMREVHYVSPAFERIWGRSVASLYANPQQWADFILPEDRERVLGAFAALTEDTPSLDIEYRIVRPAGEVRWIRVRGFQVRDAADELIRHIGIVTDINERKRNEISALAFSKLSQRLSSVASARGAFDIIKEVSRELFGWDAFCIRLYSAKSDSFYSGFTIDTIDGQPVAEEHSQPEKPGELYRRIIERGGELFQRDRPNAVPHIAPFGDLSRLSAVLMFVPIRSHGEVVGTLSVQSYTPQAYSDQDLKTLQTMADQCGGAFERIWAEEALRKSEAQLYQSQKLETVGKLAGGVAHEFNSILTAILGQCELLLVEVPAGSTLAIGVTEINQAASRAATLTRQLLAYGRKQFLRPEALDLNEVITSLEGMLRQLMGGGVDVRIVSAGGLHAVMADAGQIEQVLINMAINARDAMPNGGKLTLETANVSFDEESVGRYPELKAGDYVVLAITDTGTGMSEEVKARAFEPFFSTKGIGEGTGLGLSTCYGIVKQSAGHISVYSEPARGATFKIYLPRIEYPVKPPVQRLNLPDLPRGTETILLVEDDSALRQMAAALLRRLGYTVLAAANGVEALSLNHQRDAGHIDLLFTDIVMPHMGGKELSGRFQALYPRTKLLFTSAYTEFATVHQGVLAPGAAWLQKPFAFSTLALKVREVLDQPDAQKPVPELKSPGGTRIPDEVSTPGN